MTEPGLHCCYSRLYGLLNNLGEERIKRTQETGFSRDGLYLVKAGWGAIVNHVELHHQLLVVVG